MKRGTPDHPKMLMLTMELEKVYVAHRRRSAFGGKAEAIGLLEMLWEWTSKYAIRGDIGKWPDEAIAAGIGWTFSAKELISCLILSRWVDTAADPFRLVIHDIKDHATNCWRQNLENAGLTWWDGSSPRKYKLQKSPNKLQENVDDPPQPKPEPETEPKLKEEPPIPPAPVGADTNGSKPKPIRKGNRTTEEIQRALGERVQWWEEFWKVYPCHDGMRPAMDAFERKFHDHDLAATAYKAAKRYRAKCDADPTVRKKFAQGWINDERWTDECEIQVIGRNGQAEADPTKSTGGYERF